MHEEIEKILKQKQRRFYTLPELEAAIADQSIKTTRLQETKNVIKKKKTEDILGLIITIGVMFLLLQFYVVWETGATIRLLGLMPFVLGWMYVRPLIKLAKAQKAIQDYECEH